MTTHPWQDSALPVPERVEALLAAMTLEEKVAQLGSRWIGKDKGATGPAGPEPESEHSVAPMESEFSGGPALEDASRHGLGQLTRIYGSYPITVSEGTAELVRQQRIVMASSRLGIPAMVHEECLTGFTMHGASVYPAAIAWGATFDPELIERMAAAIGRDMAALGVHQALAPVLDVVRDYRWGRVEESIGEDPYLVGTVGSAYVRGLQSSGVLATLKHFAGYSASRGARNHGPVPMGRRELLDMILPPFEAAVRDGAGSVMNSYSDVDGVPAGADSWLLTDLLRDEWGFTGTVVSDYWAVPFLAGMHGIAADDGGAGARALEAGIDVELPDTIGYGAELVARVRSGEVDESYVERAARRVLTQKAALGLLDPEWTPEASVADSAEVVLDSAANRALAREVAEHSIVLLDPGDVLPLSGTGRMAVVGPCADDARTFLGCYAFANHVLPRYPGVDPEIELPTAAESLRAEFAAAEITYARGCAVDGDDRSGFDEAVAAARDADVCLVFVGDLAGLFGKGTSGEGCDAADLRLPGVQADLVEALLGTGTPVVVVVVSGRPYALGDFDGRAAALVQAFMPGEEGGPAIAGVLSGRVQPSGKLPVQIPRTPGGQPGTYLQPRLGAVHTGTSNLDPTPLFAFGHGLSYTTFEVGDLRLSSDRVPTDGEFSATVRVRNTGARDGAEVVQLYLSDPVAQVTRPVIQLAGFQRVELAAGAAADVVFHVHTDRTAFTGRALKRIVEPGELRVLAGTSAGDLPCAATVELTGPTRPVGPGRVITTPVEVRPEQLG
ncbi:glycoside hydrolase family 3 N-terminal domain-containing protein [Actinoplanes sichuanensis]|uniref:Glycoside hydrolase family 3 N-terminal domain-containing protein n=1 Tax=Actinoplanes sichuanensis TaxID=512349 RepID=A0ABW4A7F5_9ACTN|nr:glycoside hydrolase family 3 N-terminal domain-containing protein [Actinoplanes sichuanensis]BEL07638.1 glycoside hydrolase family 3 N-terminal domain-containing protein [Actinoplanes sichuanensis]